MGQSNCHHKLRKWSPIHVEPQSKNKGGGKTPGISTRIKGFGCDECLDLWEFGGSFPKNLKSWATLCWGEQKKDLLTSCTWWQVYQCVTCPWRSVSWMLDRELSRACLPQSTHSSSLLLVSSKFMRMNKQGRARESSWNFSELDWLGRDSAICCFLTLSTEAASAHPDFTWVLGPKPQSLCLCS